MAGGSSLTQLIFRLSLVDNLSGPAGAASGSLNRLTSHTDRIRNGMMGIGAGVVGLMAVGAAIHSVTDKAIEFEASMASVAKVVDFPSPQGFKDFSNDILKMSRTIPIAASGLAEIAAAGGEQGIQLLDLPNFVTTVAKMSTAFDIETGKAGDSIGALANIYKIPIANIGNLGDAINHLSNNANSKASDIVDVMQRVGGNAVQFGLATTQTAALGSAMLSLGMPSDVASTAINAMLMKLNTARSQGDGFQKALGGVGLSVEQLEKNISGSPQKAIDDFLGRIAKLSKHDQALAMGDLFGMEYAGKLSTLVSGLDTYKQALDNVSDPMKFAGSMQNEFATKSKTTANMLQLLSNHWDELMISFGSIVLPKIVEWIGVFNEKMAAGSDKINRWRELFPHLTSGFADLLGWVVGAIAVIAGLSIVLGIGSMLAGGFGLAWAGVSLIVAPLMTVVSALGVAFSVLWTGISSGMGVWMSLRIALSGLFAPMISMISATWAWTAALFANPITWIVIGVIALIAAIAACVFYWDEIKAAVLGFTEAMINSVSRWLESIGVFGIVNAVLSGISSVVSTIVFLFNNWSLVIGLVGQAIVSTAGTWMQSIGVFAAVDMILAAWEGLKGWWSGFKGFLAGLNPFGAIIEQVNRVISAVNSISGLSMGAIGGVATQAPSAGGVSAGIPAAKGGLSSTLRGAMGGGGKNTNVTVHNYGQKMSGATLAHEMSMAGG